MVIKRRSDYKQVGKERQVLRFAWFPKRVYGNDVSYTVWLEWYWSIEVFEWWCDISCGAQGYTWQVKKRELYNNQSWKN